MKFKSATFLSLVSGIMNLFLFMTAHAGAPIKIMPLNQETGEVYLTGERGLTSIIIEFLILNKSKRLHHVQMMPISEPTYQVQELQNPNDCNKPLLAGESCVLKLQVSTRNTTLGRLSEMPPKQVTSGSGLEPVICNSGFYCFTPSPQNSLHVNMVGAVISSSVQEMNLSVNDTALNPGLTGNPRRITITNNPESPNPAQNIKYKILPPIAFDTSISSDCTNLNPGQSCTILVTPGSTPTTRPTDLVVQGSNTNPVTIHLNVLSFGSAWHSGYVYHIDDNLLSCPDSRSACILSNSSS